jgi:hypothetical protein
MSSFTGLNLEATPSHAGGFSVWGSLLTVTALKYSSHPNPSESSRGNNAMNKILTEKNGDEGCRLKPRNVLVWYPSRRHGAMG